MPFVCDILRRGSVSIVGLAKNAGKTEVLNYVLDRIGTMDARIAARVAVTSIGIDGEAVDQVRHTPKPEIWIPGGMVFTTSETHYRQKRLVAEVLDVRNPEWAETQWRQFTDLYYKVLPEVVADEHPGAAYRKSSPYSFDDGRRSDSIGDYHDWDVWGQALEFDRFNHIRSRFFSEYGFQGFPSFQSVQRFAPEQRDWSVTSEVMLSHQRAGTNGNQKINSMMLRDYGEPCDFECFTYMSQLMQADAMRIAMESHRRQMPRCMGSLIWQHNDCWPVASWSSIDWYGTWKAQQYAIRRAFDDILVSSVVEDGRLKIYAVSDRQEKAKARLVVTSYTLAGSRAVVMREADVVVPARSSTVVWEYEFGDAPLAAQGGRDIINVVLETADGRRYENNYFAAKHKDIVYPKPTIKREFVSVEGGYEVMLTSDVFARGVCLVIDGVADYRLSDNFFDMLPGVPYTVRVSCDDGAIYEIENQLRTISYADARK